MDTILRTIFQTLAAGHEPFERIVIAVQNAVPGCEEELIRERIGRLILLGVLDIEESEECYMLTDRGSGIWRDFNNQISG